MSRDKDLNIVVERWDKTWHMGSNDSIHHAMGQLSVCYLALENGLFEVFVATLSGGVDEAQMLLANTGLRVAMAIKFIRAKMKANSRWNGPLLRSFNKLIKDFERLKEIRIKVLHQTPQLPSGGRTVFYDWARMRSGLGNDLVSYSLSDIREACDQMVELWEYLIILPTAMKADEAIAKAVLDGTLSDQSLHGAPAQTQIVLSLLRGLGTAETHPQQHPKSKPERPSRELP